MLDNDRIEEDAYDLVSRYENRLLDVDGRFDRAKSCAILNAVSIIEAFTFPSPEPKFAEISSLD